MTGVPDGERVQVFQQPARGGNGLGRGSPLKTFTNAIGMNAVVFNVARSAGPAVWPSLLIALFGDRRLLYRAGLFFFFLATIWTVQLKASSRFVVARATATVRPRNIRFEPQHPRRVGSSAGELKRSDDSALFDDLVFFASLFIVPFTALSCRCSPGTFSPSVLPDRGCF